MSARPPVASEQMTPPLPQPILRLPFPYKLFKLLDDADKGIHSEIVSWLPQGNGFKIHDSKAFCHTIMKTYFNQSKLKSFTRQLYLYGFLKVSDGPDEGAFFHPKFVRGDREGCLSIRRNQFEGDRRQSKQRTKNILQGRILQEAKLGLNISNPRSHGRVPLADASTAGSRGGFATTQRSSSISSFTPAAPPPFDNRGEPFKAALTIFDKVFNLIDDYSSCDAACRNKNRAPRHVSSSHSQSWCGRLPEFRKDNQQEHITLHLPFSRLQPMRCPWDTSCTTNNSTRGEECLLSNPFVSTPTTTTRTDCMDRATVADEDWLEKLEGRLGEPLLMRVEDDATSAFMGLFDLSPRPIEEMCQCQSHLHHCSAPSSSATPPRSSSSSSSMVLVTIDHHSHQ